MSVSLNLHVDASIVAAGPVERASHFTFGFDVMSFLWSSMTRIELSALEGPGLESVDLIVLQVKLFEVREPFERARADFGDALITKVEFFDERIHVQSVHQSQRLRLGEHVAIMEDAISVASTRLARRETASER